MVSYPKTIDCVRCGKGLFVIPKRALDNQLGEKYCICVCKENKNGEWCCFDCWLKEEK